VFIPARTTNRIRRRFLLRTLGIRGGQNREESRMMYRSSYRALSSSTSRPSCGSPISSTDCPGGAAAEKVSLSICVLISSSAVPPSTGGSPIALGFLIAEPSHRVGFAQITVHQHAWLCSSMEILIARLMARAFALPLNALVTRIVRGGFSDRPIR